MWPLEALWHMGPFEALCWDGPPGAQFPKGLGKPFFRLNLQPLTPGIALKVQPAQCFCAAGGTFWEHTGTAWHEGNEMKA